MFTFFINASMMTVKAVSHVSLALISVQRHAVGPFCEDFLAGATGCTGSHQFFNCIGHFLFASGDLTNQETVDFVAILELTDCYGLLDICKQIFTFGVIYNGLYFIESGGYCCSKMYLAIEFLHTQILYVMASSTRQHTDCIVQR